uniref:Glutamine amidotransferase type-2 domain-containing protein n=1 Tax=Anopheles coluzzii TaxID=1518534 RepID=A0A8W7Q172_ANOCL
LVVVDRFDELPRHDVCKQFGAGGTRTTSFSRVFIMCGIFCYLCTNNNTSDGELALETCRDRLKNRGPNHDATLWYESRVLFYGSVLWHQGVSLCPQPIETDETVLIFNGDIFQTREDMQESDTRWLLHSIERCADENAVFHLLVSLRGPFSVVFLRKRENRIYFARDAIGRNSLLLGLVADSGNVFISSVGGLFASSVVHELPPNGLYFIDLKRINEPNCITLLPWTDDCTQTEQMFGNALTIQLKNELVIPQQRITVQQNFNFHQLLTAADASPPEEGPFETLLKCAAVNNTCNQLLSTLLKSIQERITNTTPFCKLCVASQSTCAHPKVGILFSGGIDCTILALLADEFVPEPVPIELLNVAFEKVNRANVQRSQIDWNVPDRLTGLSTLEELQRIKPNRKWNFVEINISRHELNEQRKTISNLVFPLRNVLDESLGAALWFASKGVGVKGGEPYTSTSRVLLLGSGADELFGGYTRHKTAFDRTLRLHQEKGSTAHMDDAFLKAYEALEEELNLDWRRLPSRNLARDDRVISDNGVTPRTPYLQEDFIALVRSLKASQRCYHPLGPGIGDKLVLRLCAYKLGLKQASVLRKRALQFGSRIADRKQNATDRSAYLED